MSEYNSIDKLKKLLEQKNKQVPAEIDSGMILEQARLTESNVVYIIRIDEDMYDIDAFKEGSKKFKRLTYDGLAKNAKHDHNTKQEVELLVECHLGIMYSYIGDQTDEKFDVVITLDEIQKIKI